MNYLFICSRNQWRSRTAEALYKNNGTHQVKSAGTASSARIRINASMLNWADIIFVMEEKHKAMLHERFEAIITSKEVIVLDIPDDYAFMEEALIVELSRSCDSYFIRSTH